jgi:hypothetical protein
MIDYLSIHYINRDCRDVREFIRYIEDAREHGERALKAVVLKPGEAFITNPCRKQAENHRLENLDCWVENWLLG